MGESSLPSASFPLCCAACHVSLSAWKLSVSLTAADAHGGVFSDHLSPLTTSPPHHLSHFSSHARRHLSHHATPLNPLSSPHPLATSRTSLPHLTTYDPLLTRSVRHVVRVRHAAHRRPPRVRARQRAAAGGRRGLGTPLESLRPPRALALRSGSGWPTSQRIGACWRGHAHAGSATPPSLPLGRWGRKAEGREGERVYKSVHKETSKHDSPFSPLILSYLILSYLIVS